MRMQYERELVFAYDDSDFFVFGTWRDGGFLLTKKVTPPPEPKTNYVDLGGVDGTIDLSEALAGLPVYKNRTISATLHGGYGDRSYRGGIIGRMINEIHGRYVRIYEPDCPGHYFLGRVRFTSVQNSLAFAEIGLEAVCDPWRYSDDESEITLTVENAETKEFVIYNSGAKTVCPSLTVTGDISFTYDGVTSDATTGEYRIAPSKLRPGDNMITVSGDGTLTLKYREAIL